MNIYTFYTDSHIEIFNRLKNSTDKFSNINLIVDKFPQECPTAEFMKSGWGDTMKKKTQLIIDAIDKGDIFIHSDCDIIYLQDPSIKIMEELGDYDLAFQSDDVSNNWYCMGFFICRPSKRVKDLFIKVYENIDKFSGNDQNSLNNIISNFMNNKPGFGFEDLKYKLLSNRFFTYGLTNPGHIWDGHDFDLPEDLITFHANWTVGVERKIKLMDYVINKYQNK